MKRGPIFRFTLWLLPSLLLLNILFYGWFSARTRDTAEDEVVRKAYIVSRLLSGLSSRALDRGDLTGLKGSIEEAFKDPHIVAVIVRGANGKVIVETSVPRPVDRVSTFETPVQLGGKTIATLVTSFVLDEANEKIAVRLRLTAALQAGLFAVLAAGMAWLCRREKLAEEKRAAGGAPFVSEETLAEWMADADMPAWFAGGREEADALSIAGISLEKAVHLLAGEADQQLHAVNRAREALARIEAWRQEALQRGGNAASLIASGREILSMIGADAPPVGGEPTAALHAVEEARVSVERLAAGLTALEGVTLLTPDEKLRAAAKLSQEGVDTIRERVFPALAVAVAAGETVAARVSPLVKMVDGCGDLSSELNRYSGELFDLADAIRLLRRDLLPDDAPGEGAEGRLNQLAERVEALATGFKRETLDLLGTANEASSAARTMLSVVDELREKLIAAGSAVEDSAAAAVMGTDHLNGFLGRAGGELVDAAPLQPADALQVEMLEELRVRLATLGDLLAAPPGPLHDPSAEQAQSLSLAAENLLLAGRFLTEIVDGAARLTQTGDGAGELQQQGRADSGAAIRQLIVAARASLEQARAEAVPPDEESPGNG